MINNKSVYSKIKSWFDSNHWKYSWNENDNIFTWAVSISNDLEKKSGNNSELHFLLDLKKDCYLIYAFSPISVESKYQHAVLQLLNSINCQMVFGAFEYNDTAYEIRFKLYVDCLNQAPSSSIIERSILIPANMFVLYGDVISDVAHGRDDIDHALHLIHEIAIKR